MPIEPASFNTRGCTSGSQRTAVFTSNAEAILVAATVREITFSNREDVEISFSKRTWHFRGRRVLCRVNQAVDAAVESAAGIWPTLTTRALTSRLRWFVLPGEAYRHA
jgi:hypothetical protein